MSLNPYAAPWESCDCGMSWVKILSFCFTCLPFSTGYVFYNMSIRRPEYWQIIFHSNSSAGKLYLSEKKNQKLCHNIYHYRDCELSFEPISYWSELNDILDMIAMWK